MITAIAPAMVTAFIPMDQKGKAMGIIMTIAALGMAIGPTIGGVLTQYLSWHWIFFINVPVGIFAVLLGARVIPPSGTHDKLEGFDTTGAALVFAGLAALLFAVSEGERYGWTSPVIIVAFALAAILLCSFARQELRTPDPLLELRLFANRNFLVTNLVVSLVFFSFAGVNYLLPFYLEYVLGYETSFAGLILTVLSFAMMVAGLLAGVLFDRVGGRALCIAAGFVLAAGYFLLIHLKADTTTLFVSGCLLLVGFGLGMMITPASYIIMNSVARKYQGMVSSLTSLERFAPMTIGIAFFNLVFLEGVALIAAHRGVTQEAPAAMRLQVLASGFDLAYLVTFIIGIVILFLALFVREEIHPDYLTKSDDDEPVMGML
jgi:EmrB/QacA subfamily drug resistance transporter